MLFQGQEFLEDAWFHDQDPIDWTQGHTPPGHPALYRDLIRLRRNGADKTRGLRGHHVNVHHVNDDDNVIAFHRWTTAGPATTWSWSSTSATAASTRYRIGLPGRAVEGPVQQRLGRLQRRLFDDHSSVDTMADDEPRDGMAHSGDVGIGRYTAIVLSQDAI